MGSTTGDYAGRRALPPRGHRPKHIGASRIEGRNTDIHRPKRPEDKLVGEINKFLLDIQNRARFFRYHFEGDLVSTVFNDGGDVQMAYIRVDLGYS
jgi:hypothetical protein